MLFFSRDRKNDFTPGVAPASPFVRQAGIGQRKRAVDSDADRTRVEQASEFGELRTVEILPANRTAIDARKLPAAIDALLKEVNSDIERAKTTRQMYDLSFRTHYQLLLLQPFGAGNGRVARLVMNYVQHYHALPMSVVDLTDRPAYVASLQQSRREGNEQAFLRFMHDRLSRFMRLEIEHFTA